MSGESKDAAEAERGKAYKDFLGDADKAKYCCPDCTFRRGEGEIYENPCKMNHEDSGPLKEICDDNPVKRYHSKK